MYCLGERGDCAPRILLAGRADGPCANVIQTLTVCSGLKMTLKVDLANFLTWHRQNWPFIYVKLLLNPLKKKFWSLRYSFELEIPFLLHITFSVLSPLPLNKHLNYLLISFFFIVWKFGWRSKDSLSLHNNSVFHICQFLLNNYRYICKLGFIV